jgi:hypothetical protein
MATSNSISGSSAMISVLTPSNGIRRPVIVYVFGSFVPFLLAFLMSEVAR